MDIYDKLLHGVGMLLDKANVPLNLTWEYNT